MAFQAYGEPLENVTAFKYLGRVMTAGGKYWLEVAGNLHKIRNIWVRLSRILSREGAETKVLGHLFKAVVQAVLVFGAETWVLTPRPERALGRFQHRVKRWITAETPKLPASEQTIRRGPESVALQYIARPYSASS